MNRVVGARPVTGNRVFFQGATARNKALVAAFEILTGKEIIVSPNCHVMGAFGAALLAREAKNISTRFRGLDVFEQGFEISYETCELCLNKCTISMVSAPDGSRQAWGYKCGREGGEKPSANKKDHFRSIIKLGDVKINPAKKRTRGRIGIPRALSMYSYLPLWRTFFEELDYEVKVTGVSTKREKEKGVRISKADFCFPVKVALAHAQELSQEEIVDAVFFPTIISEKNQKNNIPRVFCPYVISFSSIAKQGATGVKPVMSPSDVSPISTYWI